MDQQAAAPGAVQELDLVPLSCSLIPAALARVFQLPGFGGDILAQAAAPSRGNSLPRSQQQKHARDDGRPTASGQHRVEKPHSKGGVHPHKATSSGRPHAQQAATTGTMPSAGMAPVMELSGMNPGSACAPHSEQHAEQTKNPATQHASASMPETSYHQLGSAQERQTMSAQTSQGMMSAMQNYMPYGATPQQQQQLMAAASAHAYMQQYGAQAGMQFGGQGPGMPYQPFPGYPPMMGYGMGGPMDYPPYRASNYGSMSMGCMPSHMGGGGGGGGNGGGNSAMSDDDDDGGGGARAVKRPRLVWTAQLHKRFEEAINKLGWDKAVPKNIMQEMNVEGLTRENVASHLQKYRLQVKRGDEPRTSEELAVSQPALSSHAPLDVSNGSE